MCIYVYYSIYSYRYTHYGVYHIMYHVLSNTLHNTIYMIKLKMSLLTILDRLSGFIYPIYILRGQWTA